jgi:hypothetical protein
VTEENPQAIPLVACGSSCGGTRRPLEFALREVISRFQSNCEVGFTCGFRHEPRWRKHKGRARILRTDGCARRAAMASTVRRVGATGLVLGLGLGAVSMLPAHADSPLPIPVPAVGGLLGTVDGGLLGGLVGGLLQGQGGVFGPDGGVIAGDDQVGDVVGGLTSGDDSLLGGLEAVGAVGDVVANPQIGGGGSFADPSVGGGPATGGLGFGGLLGGLLSGGTGLLGGVL